MLGDSEAMKGRRPAISVVVPVHNAQDYLAECLDTILNQTWQDFEVIAVNDSSTDDSGALLAEYAGRDERVMVIDHNGNAGTARNAGLERAKGSYVVFLDADDFFDPDLFSSSYAIAEKSSADIVLFGGRRYDEKQGTLSKKQEFLRLDLAPADSFSPLEAKHHLFQITNPAPWTKLFRRDFLRENHLSFPSLPNAEDLAFSLTALASAHQIAILDKDLVRYRVNTGTNVESAKHKSPLSFLMALRLVRESLLATGMIGELEDTLTVQILSTIKYNLATNPYTARTQILGALTTDFLDIGQYLTHEDDWYPTSNALDNARYIRSALKQEKTMRLESGSESEQLGMSLVIDADRSIIPDVSIIVPVYNTQDYIAETLRSVQAQTCSNIEIICIDDGSSDSSLEILKEIASEDPRVLVYGQQNCGLSMTRNRGLSVAKGEFVLFLDSDDKLEVNAAEMLTAKAREENLDMVLFDAESFFEDESLRQSHSSYVSYYDRSGEYGGVYCGPELLREMVEAGDYLPSACLYMCRRSFAKENGLAFHPGIYHEDNAFTFKCFLSACRVSHINKPLYKRRVRSSSIMTAPASFQHAYGYYVCFQEMLQSFYSSSSIAVCDSDTREVALSVVFAVQDNAIKTYSKIPNWETGGLIAFSKSQKRLFDKAVVYGSTKSASSPAVDEMRKLEKKLGKSQKALDKLKGSRSYRVGRTLTSPLRWMKKHLVSQ